MQWMGENNEILIIQADRQRSIQLDIINQNKTIAEWKDYIIDLFGYSSRIYLYQRPVTPFHKLSFIKSCLTLRQILAEFPHLCFTYNNTQGIEQAQFADNFPSNPQKFILVLQICQGTTFSHQRYQIDATSNINFVKSLASRYGHNVYFQYYQLRISIDKFGKGETLSDIFTNIGYGKNTILVTVDSAEDHSLFRCVTNENIVNLQKYYLVKMQDYAQTIVLDRQANWKVVNYLLPLIFSTNLYAGSSLEKLQQLQQFKPTNQITTIFLSKKKQSKYYFDNSLRNSLLLGMSNGMILILQQSNFLHIFSDQPPFPHINSVVLNGKPSNFLQEDLPVLHNDYLIMYNITRTAIALKYYDLPRGNLAFIKHFTWPQETYDQIQCSSLDLLAVSIKNANKARIFYVYDPNNYYQIDAMKKRWKIWVSKLGCNNYSDNSGIFAIFHNFINIIEVYSMKAEQKLTVIKMQCREVQYIRFPPSLQTILVKTETKIIEFSTSSAKMSNVLSNKYEKAYYSPDSQLFWLTEKVFHWKNSSQQKRIDNMIILYKGQVFSKDEQLIMHSIEGIYVLEKNKEIQS